MLLCGVLNMNETREMEILEKEINKKMSERKELSIELSETDRKFEKNKIKRCLCTIAFYAVIYAVIEFKFFLEEKDLKEIIAVVIGSVFLAGITFLINALIFSHLINGGNRETRIVEEMKKEISKIDNELDELRKDYTLSEELAKVEDILNNEFT